MRGVAFLRAGDGVFAPPSAPSISAALAVRFLGVAAGFLVVSVVDEALALPDERMIPNWWEEGLVGFVDVGSKGRTWESWVGRTMVRGVGADYDCRW